MIVDIRGWRLQCSTCGTPVDFCVAPVARALSAEVEALCGPCGHTMQVKVYDLAMTTDEMGLPRYLRAMHDLRQVAS